MNKLSKAKIIYNLNNHIEGTSTNKMPIFLCDCGAQILIVPDISAMNAAIGAHLVLHKQLTGKTLTEQELTEKILSILSCLSA
jgi:hypothetical protein